MVECIKCKRQGRIDVPQLIEKLGATYSVHQAKDRLTKDGECEKPELMPAYAIHPRAMYCFPPLPEWQERVEQYWVDVNNGRRPEPLYAEAK